MITQGVTVTVGGMVDVGVAVFSAGRELLFERLDPPDTDGGEELLLELTLGADALLIVGTT